MYIHVFVLSRLLFGSWTNHFNFRKVVNKAGWWEAWRMEARNEQLNKDLESFLHKYPEASSFSDVDICLSMKGFSVPLPPSLESSPPEE